MPNTTTPCPPWCGKASTDHYRSDGNHTSPEVASFDLELPQLRDGTGEELVVYVYADDDTAAPVVELEHGIWATGNVRFTPAEARRLAAALAAAADLAAPA